MYMGVKHNRMGRTSVIRLCILLLIVVQFSPYTRVMASDDCEKGCYDYKEGTNVGDNFTWYCEGLTVDISEDWRVKDIRHITQIEIKIIKSLHTLPEVAIRRNVSEYMQIEATVLNQDNITTDPETIEWGNGVTWDTFFINPNGIEFDGRIHNFFEHQVANEPEAQDGMGHETLDVRSNITRTLEGDKFVEVRDKISFSGDYLNNPPLWNESINWYGLEVTEIDVDSGFLISWDYTREDPEGNQIDERHIAVEPFKLVFMEDELVFSNISWLIGLGVLLLGSIKIRASFFKRT